MSDNNQRLRRYLATAAIYLAVAASVFGFNVIRSSAARQAAQPAQPDQPTVVSTAPYFSLTTNRTYSPNETARLWASYQNIEYLDFRVYHVKDPSKFFKQLDDPHQMGEKEKEAVSQGYGVRVSVLEGVNVDIARAKQTLTNGTTDKTGVFKAEIKPPQSSDQPPEDVDPEAAPKNAYLIMAHERDNFVISDVESFYFSGGGGEDDALSGNDLTSYIYTDRPIY